MNILLILIMLIAIILINKKSKRRKINAGEKEVKETLSKIKGYKLLNDIMIKGNNGTSQIDHILIGKKGIFVIETKDYSGMIYGDEYSREWIQVINLKKNKFYNPIRQNYGHIKALERYITRKDIFISLIVFTDKSTLKKIETDTPVLQLKKLKKFIRKYKSDNNLTKEEIDNIYNLIKKHNINSSIERRRHVKRISKIIS